MRRTGIASALRFINRPELTTQATGTGRLLIAEIDARADVEMQDCDRDLQEPPGVDCHNRQEHALAIRQTAKFPTAARTQAVK